jgi:peptidoglycan/xylan/chitin deacetylase (PgdA/CDA1 family)
MGVKSTFLFRTHYDGDQRSLLPNIEVLRGSACEISLHSAALSHRKPGALAREIAAFAEISGARPQGVRHHSLKFKVPDTWTIEASEGLEYDTTFSSLEFFGFKGGVCFPYHPFNESRIPILELPTSFMDWTALKRNERGERLATILDELLNIVRENHGLLVVNFHNTYLNSETFPDVFAAYVNLIRDIKTAGYWVATASECAKWWNSRTSSKSILRIEDKKVKGETSVPLVCLDNNGSFEIEIQQVP